MQNTKLESGTYEIIRNRLGNQAGELRSRLEQLNDSRKVVFGAVETELIANERINTENNCTARDIVAVGNHCIFGYNVLMGLRSGIRVSDVFSVYGFADGGFREESLDWFVNEKFETDFLNLYRYYKNAYFARFVQKGAYLYMVFHLNKEGEDFKTFKFIIKDDTLRYVDNRSDHEVAFPTQHEFKWVRAHRDFQRSGSHPHVSIMDRVFVETVGGDLTIKVEDNTDDGLGIYHEEVEYADQTLDDAEYFYADLGNLIVLKIRPYQEEFRYFVFNEKMQQAQRIDALESSGVLLPDQHGLIFANGYYLQTGEFKIFDPNMQKKLFKKRITSPNGEDFLYVFYNVKQAVYVLMHYNIIEQKVHTPILCNGYTHFPNGELCYFRAENEASKHHVIQIWQTPFTANDIVHSEHTDSYLYKVGNKDIVKAMAECQEVLILSNKEDTYSGLYTDLVKKATDVIDSYYWIDKPEGFKLHEPLREIRTTATTAIDEFEKKLRIQNSTKTEINRVHTKATELFDKSRKNSFDAIDLFVEMLAELRVLRGEIISLKELRYTDLELIEKLEIQCIEITDSLSEDCVKFLLEDNALVPYIEKIKAEEAGLEQITTATQAKELEGNIDQIGKELELLIEIVSNLKIDDPTQTTRIIDNISSMYAGMNQVKAAAKKAQKSLMGTEAVAEFNAQLKLLDQGIINYLDIADSPQKCDEYLTKLMVQLEELESKFAEFDEYILKITEKREEIYSVFEARKNDLLESRNNRTSALQSAAERILNGIRNRVKSIKEVNEINGFFAADLMIDKVRNIITQLTDLDDSNKANSIQTQLKTLREEAIRQLRDKQDLFVDGQNIIKFGRHKFSVNVQPLDLTIVQENGNMKFHLTGTNFYDDITDSDFLNTKDIWSQSLISENKNVYRAEYLAYQLFNQDRDTLLSANGQLLNHVQKAASTRYQEAYTKGIHDEDAAKILTALLQLSKEIDLLCFTPNVRACARVFWEEFLNGRTYAVHPPTPSEGGDRRGGSSKGGDSSLREEQLAVVSPSRGSNTSVSPFGGGKGVDSRPTRDLFKKQLKSASVLLELFPDTHEFDFIIDELENEVKLFQASTGLFTDIQVEKVAEYLFRELARSDKFIISSPAAKLHGEFLKYLKEKKSVSNYENSVRELEGHYVEQFQLIRKWLHAFITQHKKLQYESYINETATLLLLNNFDKKCVIKTDTTITISDLHGMHALVEDGSYRLDYNDFTEKMETYEREVVPRFARFLEMKKDLADRYKSQLRLNEFEPRVLSSFVRNQLIDKVYLPTFGDNLAKQIGTADENTRTDRMGLLLLISPPGYGKTTLMEYIANRLGLIFMKINGPALGHHVTSLDPADAPNAAAAQELEKLNLALEMGDNVMLYVDDIQHCNPEFLQKFISLCDAQRKIEGVFRGASKTYDLRGKRIAVVMAGNPYTESGDKFQIPDMLANRADIYNLGDILGDSEAVFKMSYIENAMTSNPVLQKLAGKSQKDIYTIIQLAETGSREGLEFEGNHSPEELNEYVNVLGKMLTIRDVVLKVNQEYIRSAAMNDDYRTEPAFKLQGSYRNMNKLAEKVVPIMNDKELDTLILSHYEGESQTLTNGAEANFLKLKELLGKQTKAEKSRWNEIKTTFNKNKIFRNVDGNDPMAQVLAQMTAFTEGLEGIREVLEGLK